MTHSESITKEQQERPISGMDDQEARRDAEFLANEADTWGWDGCHVEDAVSFARMYRRLATQITQSIPLQIGRDSELIAFGAWVLAENSRVEIDPERATKAVREALPRFRKELGIGEKVEHASDCAVHNMPAYPNGPCDCGRTLGASHV